jgi:hypothetical protein
MDEQHDIALIGAGDDERAVFTEYEIGPVCKLTCAYRGKTIEADRFLRGALPDPPSA